MTLPLKILLFLLSILCTLPSAARANNSSDKHILSYQPKILLPISVSPQTGNDWYIHNQYWTDPWVTHFVPAIDTLVVILGLPLNILAILMFAIKTKIKKPAVVYMLNLASADIVLVAMLPFKISYFSRKSWAFGPGMCSFFIMTFICNMHSSILLLTAISIDRFLAVVYPMQSLSWRTLRRASVVCVAIWLVALAGVVPLYTSDLTHHIPQLNITTCFDTPDVSLVLKSFHYYFLSLSIFFFFVPLLICTTCYVCIIRKLSSFNGAAQPGKKRRAIFLSAAVLCSFIVCFGPTYILSLLQDVWPTQIGNMSVAHNLCLCIGTINCCIDPLIFYYASSKFQKQVWNLLCQRKHSDLVKDLRSASSNASARGLVHLSQA